MTKEIDQRAQRHDPASTHTRDSNDRPDDQTKQPGRGADGTSDAPDGRITYDPDRAPDEEWDETTEGAGTREVRPSGTEHMKDPPKDWKKEDEESDESFPASDPPANY